MYEYLNFWIIQDKNFDLRKMINNKLYEEYRGIENYKPVAQLINFSAIVKKFQNGK